MDNRLRISDELSMVKEHQSVAPKVNASMAGLSKLDSKKKL